MQELKRIVMDLDGTLTIDDSLLSYAEKLPNMDVVNLLHQYKIDGYEICIFTARNMQTHNSVLGKINAFTLPIIIDWLNKYNVPYDEIYVGKPWCGADGFYVDDKAIRPSEFLTKSKDEIKALLKLEK